MVRVPRGPTVDVRKGIQEGKGERATPRPSKGASQKQKMERSCPPPPISVKSSNEAEQQEVLQWTETEADTESIEDNSTCKIKKRKIETASESSHPPHCPYSPAPTLLAILIARQVLAILYAAQIKRGRPEWRLNMKARGEAMNKKSSNNDAKPNFNHASLY